MRNDSGRASRAEDVDLVEVMLQVWRQRWTVLVIALVITLCACAYAYLAKPIYEVKLRILPPVASDIAELNYGRDKLSNLDVIGVKQVFSVYLQHVRSESVNRTFFQTVYLRSIGVDAAAGWRNDLYQDFIRSLDVTPISDTLGDHLQLSLRGSDPHRLADWLMAYASLAGDAAKDEIVTNVRREVEVRAEGVGQQIEVARLKGSKSREDKIVQLREALRIATLLGLEKPMLINDGRSAVTPRMGDDLTYMRGAKALRAEITGLENRANDDPFINELRGLQARQRLYEEIAARQPDIVVFQVDGAVEQPEVPIKPKRLTIVILALIAGLFIGSLVTLIRYLFSHYKLSHARGL